MNTSFFGELLQTISERGRAFVERTRERRGSAAALSDGLIEQCEDLLSGRGEASGVARAAEILAQYALMTTGPRIAFFEALGTRFGPDRDRTVASAYSVRAVPDARVSCPLEWAEVPEVDPGELRLDTVPARLAERGDPSADIDARPASLDPLLELAARDEREGLGDAPWPPHFRKQKGEPPRVQPSRARAAKR